MKILKITLLVFLVIANFIACKEAVDKQKDGSLSDKALEKKPLFAKNVNALDFKNLMVADSTLIIDVRTPEEYQESHIQGAINIDWKNQDEFTAKSSSLNKARTILVYCHSGHRSNLATQYLRDQGFEKLYNLETGIVGWKAENFAVVK